MPTRILLRDQVVWRSRDSARPVDHRRGLPRDKKGNPVGCAYGIPPSSPESPYRAGVTLIDREEGIAYRCVDYLNPLCGWATTEIWQKRWCVDHRGIIAFVSGGFLDAAIEAGSAVKRYRCRDENRLLDSDLYEGQQKRFSAERKWTRRTKRSRSRM